MKRLLRTGLLCACLAAPLVSVAEVPTVTGEHWTDATEQQKRAFILGMATIVEIEHEFQANDPPAPGSSAILPIVNGLSDYTFEGVVRGLDQWYTDNPDDLERAVIEVIWTEMVLPNLDR